MLTQSWLHRITGKEVATPTKQNADQQTGTQDTPADARWEQNTATIYINISNPVLKNATETAIAQWNNTKAFTFMIRMQILVFPLLMIQITGQRGLPIQA